MRAGSRSSNSSRSSSSGRSLVAPALLLVLFRVLDALSLRTYFNPDEYWQGPEVAHKLVFGVGLLCVRCDLCVYMYVTTVYSIPFHQSIAD